MSLASSSSQDALIDGMEMDDWCWSGGLKSKPHFPVISAPKPLMLDDTMRELTLDVIPTSQQKPEVSCL